DKHLTWENFSQPNYCMIAVMKQQEWPDKFISMICNFWVTFETHLWRHNLSEYQKRVLLPYQGRVCRDWHKTLGTSAAFRLLPLREERLNELHQGLLDNAYVAKIEVVPMVCLSFCCFFFAVQSPKLMISFTLSMF
ncbi:hypothetical protein PAXRUDRAFT_85670, partial [Paxillus rubicundulus Ve08.2h10]